MKKLKEYSFVFSLITCVAVLAAAVASFVVLFERKKKEEDAELNEYLDGAIL